MYGSPQENGRFQVSFGATFNAHSQNKVGLSMESKMYGFPYENDRFQVSLGATFSAHSQK